MEHLNYYNCTRKSRYKDIEYSYKDIFDTNQEDIQEEYQDEFIRLKDMAFEENQKMALLQAERKKREESMDEVRKKLWGIRNSIDWNSEIPKAVSKALRETEYECSVALEFLNECDVEISNKRAEISKIYRKGNDIVVNKRASVL